MVKNNSAALQQYLSPLLDGRISEWGYEDTTQQGMVF